MLMLMLLATLPALSTAASDFTSFSGDTKCSSQPPTSAVKGASNVNYALDYVCDSLQPPSGWQKMNDDGVAQYDVAIVGAGMGGIYIISRLHEEYVLNRSLPMPKVALFERSNMAGGRLMSGFGGGGLGLGVGPYDHYFVANPPPIPEYGGMRVDPDLYPLLYNRILYYSHLRFGPGTCNQTCNNADWWKQGENCCPKMLSRMEVGAVRYARGLDTDAIVDS